MPNLQSLLLLVASLLAAPIGEARKAAGPWSDADRKKLVAELEARVQSLTRRIDAAPRDEELYSKRGDAQFFLGRFEKAVADYEKTVELRPSLEASHWRRGIAYFYAGEYEKAARQFEIYHSFDDVDRENGIWRYLSQFRAHGRQKARRGLLKYEKDDREPFADVYRLFSGEIADPGTIIEKIEKADIGETEREKRRFYAHLYIGLNEAIEGRDRTALEHLRRARNSRWGRQAGFGPNYMWHVGRIHCERLEKKVADQRSGREEKAGAGGSQRRSDTGRYGRGKGEARRDGSKG